MAESLQLMVPGVALDGLPDSFSFELNDHNECALGVFATIRGRAMWERMKNELCRRGYALTECMDYDRMVRVVHCKREAPPAPRGERIAEAIGATDFRPRGGT